MTDNLRESISALMDDEANEMEVHRVLSKMEDDEFRNTWKRYQTVRSVMNGQVDNNLQIDISKGVSEAIANESLELDEGIPMQSASSNEVVRPVWDRFTKPLTSVAVAASVAFVVVFGVSQLNQDDGTGSAVEVAEQSKTDLPSNAIALANSVGSEDIVTVSSEQLTDSQKKIRMLMKRHAQQADITLGRGVMPSAQLVSEESRGY